MRFHFALFAPAVLLAGALAAPARAAVPFAGDSLRAALVNAALAARPELAQARNLVSAEEQRVPQARALPDPVVSLGLQNDGFRRLQIGTMETSYWALSAAQTLPWRGKRDLRAHVQELAANQAGKDLERVRLGVRAEVERAYVDLLEARGQLGLLARSESLWDQAESLARSRYETGGGAQSDVLRAQLQRARLRQRRAALAAEEQRRLTVLARVAGRPGGSLETPLALDELADPALPDSAAALADAEERTPELGRARLAVAQSDAQVALARRDVLPDFTVSGGVMPRGGAFEPMWQAGLSLSLPLWARGKQSRAIEEARLRGGAVASSAEALYRLVNQRVAERRMLLAALLETNQIYRAGLLIQSDAAVQSALAQYQVGRVPFASVLEALDGWLADQSGYLESLAATQRVDIASRELSLDSVAGPALGGPGGGAMPGATGMSAAPASSSSAPSSPSPAASPSSSPAMPRM